MAPAKAAPVAKAKQLEADAVDAHRRGGDLVLANRHPGAPDARILEPQTGRDEQRDERDADVIIGRRVDAETVAEELRGGDPVQPHRTIGDARDVARDDRHDLAKAQGHDRQVVAFEPQCRRAKEDAEKSGNRGRDRHHQPERHLEMDDVAAATRHPRDEVEPAKRLPKTGPRRLQLKRGSGAVNIGADREKRGVAEVEQTGKADDDVEPERQCGEGKRVRRRIDVGVVAMNKRKRQRRRRNQKDREAGADDRRTPGDQRQARRPRAQCRCSDSSPLADSRHPTICSAWRDPSGRRARKREPRRGSRR